jgi:peptidoglycan/LPS O-acetylase OafA/YrhL
VLPLRRGLVSKLLAWRPLSALGVASYSLYIWHLPVLRAVDGWPTLRSSYVVLGVVGGAICVAVAAASYAVIERPFLRLRKTWTREPAPAPHLSERQPVIAG